MSCLDITSSGQAAGTDAKAEAGQRCAGRLKVLAAVRAVDDGHYRSSRQSRRPSVTPVVGVPASISSGVAPPYRVDEPDHALWWLLTSSAASVCPRVGAGFGSNVKKDGRRRTARRSGTSYGPWGDPPSVGHLGTQGAATPGRPYGHRRQRVAWEDLVPDARGVVGVGERGRCQPRAEINTSRAVGLSRTTGLMLGRRPSGT